MALEEKEGSGGTMTVLATDPSGDLTFGGQPAGNGEFETELLKMAEIERANREKLATEKVVELPKEEEKKQTEEKKVEESSEEAIAAEAIKALVGETAQMEPAKEEFFFKSPETPTVYKTPDEARIGIIEKDRHIKRVQEEAAAARAQLEAAKAEIAKAQTAQIEPNMETILREDATPWFQYHLAEYRAKSDPITGEFVPEQQAINECWRVACESAKPLAELHFNEAKRRIESEREFKRQEAAMEFGRQSTMARSKYPDFDGHSEAMSSLVSEMNTGTVTLPELTYLASVGREIVKAGGRRAYDEALLKKGAIAGVKQAMGSTTAKIKGAGATGGGSVAPAKSGAAADQIAGWRGMINPSTRAPYTETEIEDLARFSKSSSFDLRDDIPARR